MTIYSMRTQWGKAAILSHDVKLAGDDIVIWFDVISDETMADMIKNNGIPGLIISTAHAEKFTNLCPVDHWPSFLLKTSLDMFPGLGAHDHLPIESCANFLINKKQKNRELLVPIFQKQDLDFWHRAPVELRQARPFHPSRPGYQK